MTANLLARKGEANPATTHHGGESRFQAKRIVVLPPIALNRPSGSDSSHPRLPRRAANMAKPFRLTAARRKFTFRIETERHHAFCAAAEKLGTSRQELLTRALDTYLEMLDIKARDHTVLIEAPGEFPTSHHTGNPVGLQLPLHGIS